MDSSLRQEIALKMIKLKKKKGEYILEENYINESIYIIKEGILLQETLDGKQIKLLSNDYFGESFIFGEKEDNSNISVETEVAVVYQIPVTLLSDFLGQTFSKQLFKAVLKQAFIDNVHLKCLTIDEIFYDMYPIFEKYTVPIDGDFIFRKKEKDKMLYYLVVVISGSIYKVSF